MQEKDNELDSILQEARENYQRRIDDLIGSLKSISASEDAKSDLEKFSPFKTTLGGTDSLKYSASFKPIGVSQSEDKGYQRLKASNSADNSYKIQPISPKFDYQANNELLEEVKNLTQQVNNLEENLTRWKKSCQEAETVNTELRYRLKDAKVQINQLSEALSYAKEYKKEAYYKEQQNLKAHYNEKLEKLRGEWLVNEAEKQKSLSFAINEKEALVNELQTSIQKSRIDYEQRLRQLTEDNNSKSVQIHQLTDELTRQNDRQVKLKLELEVQLEGERIKTVNLESKFLRIESAYEELQNKFQGALHKNQILEKQLAIQSAEFQKKHEQDGFKYIERVKVLENELRSLYDANSAQSKEMEALKLLCAEVEVKQDQDLKALQQKHEDNIREIKRSDRYEYLQLSDTLEATKAELAHLESTLSSYEAQFKAQELREREYLQVIKSYELFKADSNRNISGLNAKLVATSKILSHVKEIVSTKLKKMKENIRNVINSINEELKEYQQFLQKFSVGLVRAVESSTSSLHRNLNEKLNRALYENSEKLQKVLTENHEKLQKALYEKKIATEEFHRSQEQIKMLEITLQHKHNEINSKVDENLELRKHFEGKADAERVKGNYNAFLRQIFAQINFLEGNIDDSYNELVFNVKTLKETIREDNEEAVRHSHEILENAKKSIEFYRDKLLKIENEKALEMNKSQQELFNLEKRLSQVLEDIREQKD